MDEKTTQPVTSPDDELDAMRAVKDTLGKLDAESARRVLQWAAERFGIKLSLGGPGGGPPTEQGWRPSRGAGEGGAPDLASFFTQAAPTSGPEKALVVAYHQQVVQGMPELDSQSLNSELKHLGTNLSNITATLSQLIHQNPALVMQTKKMGRGQQARKRYKLTNAGMLRVREMLARAKAGIGKEG